MAIYTTTITSKDVRNSSLIDDDFKLVEGGYLGVQDNKLAPITSAGKVANSATTAVTTATPDTIVLRDTTGSISVLNLNAISVVTSSFNTNNLTTSTLTVLSQLYAPTATGVFQNLSATDINVASTISCAVLETSFATVNNSLTTETIVTNTANNIIRSSYAYADLPDATTVEGMFAVVTDDGYLYYSDGTSWVKIYSADTVDGIAIGLQVKDPVNVATTADITLANEQTIDDVPLVAGDRVLVKNQTDPIENGIYDVVDAGPWTRSSDADSDAKVNTGMYVLVLAGTDNANTGWTLITPEPFVLDTDGLTFVQMVNGGNNGITSVDFTAPAGEFIVSGAPITSIDGTGTIGLAWNQQSPNTVLAGPTGVLPANPTFRLLTSADIPVMVGATTSLAGRAGAVPAPTTLDTLKFLRGDGTWVTPGGSGLGSVTFVALTTAGTGLTVTGSPITTSGTFTLGGTLAPSNGGTGLNSVGTALQFLRTNASATGLEWATISGTLTPGGSNTQVQFNDGGVFGGSASLTFDKTLGILSATTFTGDGSTLTGLTKSQVGLGNVTNNAQVLRTEMGVAEGVATLDVTGKVPLTQLPASAVVSWGFVIGTLADQTDLVSALNAKIDVSTKGQANGVASLDGSGKVPLAQLPALGSGDTGLWAVNIVTTNTSLDETYTYVRADATSGNIVITLPLTGSISDGRFFYIKKKDSSANTVTIIGDTGDTMDGAASVVLSSQGQVIGFIYTGVGTDWDVI
jgi:hypothetical protein